MNTISNSHQNHLLAALPAEDYERIAPHLELVMLHEGEALLEVGDKLRHVYFPVTATASLLCNLEDGASVEVASVGNEGLVGVSIFMGNEGALTQATVQTGGSSYRLSAKVLKEEFERGGALQHFLMRYTRTLFIQMAQTTACNRRHSVEQQLCRWLLLNFDRLHTNTLETTQESISHMLGVRRESVTEAARRLQSAGMINYHRKHIEVADRSALEAHVCECYNVVRRESERFFSELHG
jgi:transcriptional regulator, Crp/Fnr family